MTMLQNVDLNRGARLDIAAWHKPLVSIIITHFNYSDFVRDAILSVLGQTHQNWELVVVDDASEPEHRERLNAILSEINDERVRCLPLADNVGQVLAFFAGLDVTRGEFCCLLDPDDRYAPTFLEEALATHLNEFVLCPVVSTDQYLLSETGLVGAVFRTRRLPELVVIGDGLEIPREPEDPQVQFIPIGARGWHWASTSSLMFRRAALRYLKPPTPLGFRRAADSYLAQGAHMLGGTLYLPKPLVYRSLHDRNGWISNQIYSSFQQMHHARAEHRAKEARERAIETLLHHGAPIEAIEERFRSSRGIYQKAMRLLAKWKRSILKRLPVKK